MSMEQFTDSHSGLGNLHAQHCWPNISSHLVQRYAADAQQTHDHIVLENILDSEAGPDLNASSKTDTIYRCEYH